MAASKEIRIMFDRAKVMLIGAILAAVFSVPLPAFAKSVQDFEAMPPAGQSEYIVGFLEKMTYDIGRQNPQLAQQIKDYFVRKQPGKPFSEGMEKVSVELAALDGQARAGKANLSKIQLESIVVWVVKQKFPPPATAQK
jgi:hypothetical protein